MTKYGKLPFITARFEIRRGKLPFRKYRFVLIADNGEIVATSETYNTKQGALVGIASVKSLAADAEVVDRTL